MFAIVKSSNFIIKQICYGYLTKNQIFAKSFKLKVKLSKEEYNNYFQDRINSVDKESGQIIREIGKKYPDLTKLHKHFQFYLKDYTISNNRTLNGVLSLLSAINLSGIDSLNKYKSQLLQQTNRVALQADIEPINLNYFIINEADYRQSTNQKVKVSRLLFNIMIAIQNNFDKVQPQLYLHILKILCMQEKYQSNFLKIAHLIQKYTSKLLVRLLKNEMIEQRIIVSDKFICLLSEVYKIYGVFFQYITKCFLHRKYASLDPKLATINTLYRNFNYQLKNKDGQYYKQLLFNSILTVVLTNAKEIEQFAKARHGSYFCSSIITNHFYQYSQNFKFVQVGSFSYLPKQQILKKPQLPSIFWQIYKINPQSLNQIFYLQSMIKDVYPERYISTKGRSIYTLQPMMQTEMKLRVEQVLINMNIKYKSQLQVSGRYIDFLIQDDIILQIDGIQHFCINSLEMTDKSQTRNIHFLQKGYKMIIINIYEYNIAREIQQLRELIQGKLELLRSKDAVLLL